MQTLPQSVHIGTKVFDSQHREIGRVNDLRYPENVTNPDTQPAELDAADRTDQRHSLLEDVAEAFRDDDMPEPVRDRLLMDGYLRIDGDGPFGADRFVLPSQIESASADEVVLNVEKDALITKH